MLSSLFCSGPWPVFHWVVASINWRNFILRSIEFDTEGKVPDIKRNLPSWGIFIIFGEEINFMFLLYQYS